MISSRLPFSWLGPDFYSIPETRVPSAGCCAGERCEASDLKSPGPGTSFWPRAALLGQVSPDPPQRVILAEFEHGALSVASVFAPVQSASGWLGLILVPKTLRDAAGSLPPPPSRNLGGAPL